MNKTLPFDSDPRLEAISEFIAQLAAGQWPSPLVESGHGDALDRIVTQLNRLAERFNGREAELRTEAEQRLNELVEVMMSVASLDFSRRAAISETQDVIDALATGLNMLAEELESEIATRQRTENTLLKQTAKLEEAYRLQQEHQAQLLMSEKMATLGWLTAGIAHEMNTPLAAVRAALIELNRLTKEYESSLDDPGVTLEDYREITKEMLQALQLAQKAAEQASNYVRSIKSQTRDLTPQERLRFDAVQGIRDSLLLLNHALRHAKCTTRLEMPSETVYLYGSPSRLAQVVTNLVMNAIDASAAKGGGPITLRLQAADEGVTLQVSDQGAGIPPDVQPKIFNQMFTTKPPGQGTGLGLTIVHQIITGEFGGTIDFESRVGQGTTFTLHFPPSVVARVSSAAALAQNAP
jgi:signal transduction histidine kinase